MIDHEKLLNRVLRAATRTLEKYDAACERQQIEVQLCQADIARRVRDYAQRSGDPVAASSHDRLRRSTGASPPPTSPPSASPPSASPQATPSPSPPSASPSPSAAPPSPPSASPAELEEIHRLRERLCVTQADLRVTQADLRLAQTDLCLAQEQVRRLSAELALAEERQRRAERDAEVAQLREQLAAARAATPQPAPEAILTAPAPVTPSAAPLVGVLTETTVVTAAATTVRATTPAPTPASPSAAPTRAAATTTTAATVRASTPTPTPAAPSAAPAADAATTIRASTPTPAEPAVIPDVLIPDPTPPAPPPAPTPPDDTSSPTASTSTKHPLDLARRALERVDLAAARRHFADAEAEARAAWTGDLATHPAAHVLAAALRGGAEVALERADFTDALAKSSEAVALILDLHVAAPSPLTLSDLLASVRVKATILLAAGCPDDAEAQLIDALRLFQEEDPRHKDLDVGYEVAFLVALHDELHRPLGAPRT